MAMTPEKKQEIIDVLIKKGAVLPCSRCKNNNFTLLDGYFNQVIQQELNVHAFILGGPSIPSIVVACNNCGHISQHALGILGLMPKEEDKK